MKVNHSNKLFIIVIMFFSITMFALHLEAMYERGEYYQELYKLQRMFEYYPVLPAYDIDEKESLKKIVVALTSRSDQDKKDLEILIDQKTDIKTLDQQSCIHYILCVVKFLIHVIELNKLLQAIYLHYNPVDLSLINHISPHACIDQQSDVLKKLITLLPNACEGYVIFSQTIPVLKKIAQNELSIRFRYFIGPYSREWLSMSF